MIVEVQKEIGVRIDCISPVAEQNVDKPVFSLDEIYTLSHGKVVPVVFGSHRNTGFQSVEGDRHQRYRH